MERVIKRGAVKGHFGRVQVSPLSGSNANLSASTSGRQPRKGKFFLCSSDKGKHCKGIQNQNQTISKLNRKTLPQAQPTWGLSALDKETSFRNTKHNHKFWQNILQPVAKFWKGERLLSSCRQTWLAVVKLSTVTKLSPTLSSMLTSAKATTSSSFELAYSTARTTSIKS